MVKDLTGQVFGDRTVLRRIDKPLQLKAIGQTYWEVKCTCGDIGYATGSQLGFGSRSRCKACAMKRFRKIEGESSFNGLYLRYKHGAIKRNLSFLLSKDEFRHLTSCNCHYCKQIPKSIAKLKKSFGQYVYNGIDRINSKEGYTIMNCVPCCEVCNRAKSNMSYNDFINWIKQLITNRG